jgi:hypothetical protein
LATKTVYGKDKAMSHWIPFEKGTYIVERAFFVVPDNTAVALDDAVIEVYENHRGKRQLKGRGFIYNFMLVELLDNNDLLTLVLDLGETYKYRIVDPDLTAGKVFSPGVKSVLQFAPTTPWQRITITDFDELIDRMTLLSG